MRIEAYSGAQLVATLTDDVVLPAPNMDVDRVEIRQEREPPSNAVNNNTFALREELVDNCAEEQEVDEGPVSLVPSAD